MANIGVSDELNFGTSSQLGDAPIYSNDQSSISDGLGASSLYHGSVGTAFFVAKNNLCQIRSNLITSPQKTVGILNH